jgi:acyl-coenzyme A synthetase/AMP-(fatty) acid ligase
MPRFSFPEFLAYNKKYAITYFFTVPPIYLLIAKSPEVTDQFKSLEVAISGAAPLGKDLQHAASAKLGPNCCKSHGTKVLVVIEEYLTALLRRLQTPFKSYCRR